MDTNYVMLIFIECMLGKYGLNCASTCGQCGDVLGCSNIDGLCQTGCRPGFHGQLCKESKSPPVKKENKYALLKHNFKQNYFKVRSVLHTKSHFFKLKNVPLEHMDKTVAWFAANAGICLIALTSMEYVNLVVTPAILDLIARKVWDVLLTSSVTYQRH